MPSWKVWEDKQIGKIKSFCVKDLTFRNFVDPHITLFSTPLKANNLTQCPIWNTQNKNTTKNKWWLLWLLWRQLWYLLAATRELLLCTVPFLVCTFVFAIAFVFVFVQCYFLRDHVGDSFPGSEVYYAVHWQNMFMWTFMRIHWDNLLEGIRREYLHLLLQFWSDSITLQSVPKIWQKVVFTNKAKCNSVFIGDDIRPIVQFKTVSDPIMRNSEMIQSENYAEMRVWESGQFAPNFERIF